MEIEQPKEGQSIVEYLQAAGCTKVTQGDSRLQLLTEFHPAALGEGSEYVYVMRVRDTIIVSEEGVIYAVAFIPTDATRPLFGEPT